MKLSELRSLADNLKQSRDGEGDTVLAAPENTKQSKSPSIPTSSLPQNRHCRSCAHLRTVTMPTVPESGKMTLTLQAISNQGNLHTVPIEKASGQRMALCSKRLWDLSPDGIANYDKMIRGRGYFEDQARICAEYMLDRR